MGKCCGTVNLGVVFTGQYLQYTVKCERTFLWKIIAIVIDYNNNNNSDFLCANILKDQAQWHDKTK